MKPPTGPRTQAPAQPQARIKGSDIRTHSTTTPREGSGTKESRNRLSHTSTPTSAALSKPPTPTTSASVDPYQQEREARIRERERKEEQRRASLHGSGGTTQSRKRSIDESSTFTPPTGPKGTADRRGKRTRDSEGRSGKSRRISYQYEDEGRFEKGESEREAARYK